MSWFDVAMSCVLTTLGIIGLVLGAAGTYVYIEAKRFGGHVEDGQVALIIKTFFWGIVFTAWGTSPLWMR